MTVKNVIHGMKFIMIKEVKNIKRGKRNNVNANYRMGTTHRVS